MKLNLLRDKYQERMFIITSIIRMMSFSDFEEKSILGMYHTSRKLRSVEENGGNISDDKLFEHYVMEVGE